MTTDLTTEKSEKIRRTLSCEYCDYRTSDSKDFNKHLATRKHKNNAPTTTSPEKIRGDYICPNCDKSHNDRAGLWRHKKKCNQIKKDFASIITPELVLSLIDKNNELQNLLMEDRKIFIEEFKKANVGNNTNSNNTTTNTNTNSHNNSNFNLNFFLNEQCKDAINLVDFVDSLKVTVKDLERTGKLGYVDGISGIFLDGLKELDMYTRPIHCTDVKRETVYVKDQDKWEKEDENKTKLKTAIKKIARKNLQQLPKWQEENPECMDTQSRSSDMYVTISQQSLGGLDAKEDTKYQNTIIKNVLVNTKVPN